MIFFICNGLDDGFRIFPFLGIPIFNVGYDRRSGYDGLVESVRLDLGKSNI